MKMGSAMCVAVLFACLAVGQLAHGEEKTAQPARKLLQGMMGMSASPMPMAMPMPMDMSMSPMMMPMAPAPMMMMPPMAPAPMMMPMSYMLMIKPQTEVPGTPNDGASGMCNLTFMGDSIKYSLSVMNIYGVTAAHIHTGAPGMNGPVAAFLYKAPTMMPQNMTATNGMLSSGTLMSSDFIGPAKGMSVMDFYNKYVATNMAYVNVHTRRYPDGEIRANITPASMVKSS